jgi:Protein of unknown function (DUF4236)
MGFYIRKSFSAGPIRLNLSRSGLGASFGVKGARIGVGPRGTYVHMGRGGLYYRQTLAPPSSASQGNSEHAEQAPHHDGFQPIESGAAVKMFDTSAARLLNELNRVNARKDMFPVAAVLGAIFLLILAVALAPWWALLIGALAISVLALRLRHLDVTNGTAILEYSVEGEAAELFGKLQGSFGDLGACQMMWHVDASAHTDDWKRNAGVGGLIQRTQCQVLSSRPPKMQCNLTVPMLAAGNKRLYFFPDRVLVYDSGGVGAVPYSELHATAGKLKFVEDGPVPSDAAPAGKRWRYVNKDGGPDRRFNNNVELPILVYGLLHLGSPSGLNELFHCSRPTAASAIATALGEVARIRGLISGQTDPPKGVR